MRILVIDDEQELANSIAALLQANDYEADTAYDGKSGLRCAEAGGYDLIILDVMLPYRNGFEVLQTLREESILVPVLMLTAKGDLEDRIFGLEHGADYYLPKPFYMKELLACVRALLRRRGVLDNSLTYGNTTLEISTSILRTDTGSVRLSDREFALMKVFLVTQYRTVSKEQLITKVWGFDSEATENSVEVYISLLRKKLKAISSDLVIRAAFRRGYYLEVGRHDS